MRPVNSDSTKLGSKRSPCTQAAPSISTERRSVATTSRAPPAAKPRKMACPTSPAAPVTKTPGASGFRSWASGRVIETQCTSRNLPLAGADWFVPSAPRRQDRRPGRKIHISSCSRGPGAIASAFGRLGNARRRAPVGTRLGTRRGSQFQSTLQKEEREEPSRTSRSWQVGTGRQSAEQSRRQWCKTKSRPGPSRPAMLEECRIWS